MFSQGNGPALGPALATASALHLHDHERAAGASNSAARSESRAERRARLAAAKRARAAEKAALAELEAAAAERYRLANRKHKYETALLDVFEAQALADRGARAVREFDQHGVEVWYAETQVRHGGFDDHQGRRQRTSDCRGYNQRNMVAEAAAAGNGEALRMLLGAGLSHSEHDALGLTALLAALVGRHLDEACVVVMHDCFREHEFDRAKQRLRADKKMAKVVEGRSALSGKAEREGGGGGGGGGSEAYARSVDAPLVAPMCKAVLEGGFRCREPVAENGFCSKQSCKMQGFTMVKAKMDAARLQGETYVHCSLSSCHKHGVSSP